MISIKKFKNFVLEKSIFNMSLNSKEIDDALSIIEKDCQYYFNLLKSNPENLIILYRGESEAFLKKNPNLLDLEYFQKLKLRKNRGPKDMDFEIHQKLDNLFDQKFGIKLRSNSLFCTRDYNMAAGYGDFVCLVFPIGKFEYYWNPDVIDLFSILDSYEWYHKGNEESLRDIYDSTYGEQLLGSYYLNNQDSGTNNVEKALKYFSNQSVDFDDLVWVPDISFEEWIETRTKRNEIKQNKALNELVDGYISSNIEDSRKQEIMLVCDEYYLLTIFRNEAMNKYLKNSKLKDKLLNKILDENNN